MKFSIGVFFENLSTIFKLNLNLTKMTGTFREDVSKLVIISRSILLRVMNV